MKKLSEEPTLEDQLTASILEVEELAKKLNRPGHEIVTFLQLRELTIINQQLRVVHEHLDMIEARMKEEDEPETSRP